MPVITTKGYELANAIAKYFDDVSLLPGTCSLLCRLSVTYTRLCETECNRSLTKYEQKRMGTLEARAKALVATLPLSVHGNVGLELCGDPRGYCMKLIIPNCPHDGNTWGTGGAYGF